MSNPVSYPQSFPTPPRPSAQLLLIRHGQSEDYVPGRPFPLVDGHGDPALSALGQHQAALVGDRLQAEPIKAIYVSSLRRTSQTAAPLAQRLGIEPAVEPDLREVYLGEGEGGRLREMSAAGHPAVKAMRAERDWGALPGAETNEQLTARTVNAARRIALAHPDQMVAVFCHGGVIAAITGWAVGVGALELRGARHTSISHLWVEPPAADREQWSLRAFNDGGHAGTLAADFPLPALGQPAAE